MPATESTWRDQQKLHFLFAISGTILFIATIWMLLKDWNRQWKDYQTDARNLQIIADEWKKQHVQTAAKRREHEDLQRALAIAQAQGVDEKLFKSFVAEVEDYQDSTEMGYLGTITNLQKSLESQAAAAGEARKAADKALALAQQADKDVATAIIDRDDAKRKAAAAQPADKEKANEAAKAAEAKLTEMQSAAKEARKEQRAADTEALKLEKKAANTRADLVANMSDVLKRAKFQEDNYSLTRKFANANLDKAKADEGLVIRDYSEPKYEKTYEQKLQSQEKVIEKVDERVTEYTLEYQKAQAHRKALQATLKQITASEDKLKKDLETNRADLVRLDKAIEDRRSTYVVWWGYVPTPGKKLLEAPILDAFNSPLKIENLWSEGNNIDYNFRDVKRYDRCTTCHQLMEKSQPGAADKPGYVKEAWLTLILTPPTPERLEELKKAAKESDPPRELRVEDVFGVSIGDGGLIDANAVTIRNVEENSLATQARLKLKDAATSPRPGGEIRDALMKSAGSPAHDFDLDDPSNPFTAVPGLMVGDVFVDVDGSMVRTAAEARRFLLDGALAQKSLSIRIRRGLPSPFTSHPRLDLFVGSLSPHKMQEFGCTSCHEGQGSATDFKWASHTPNSTEEMKDWARKYGWFDNHHWIYPMNSKRFAESSCLKCHHEVVDLEPSQRFPEEPAPKVVRGYNLIRKYGCYGCHEMNGYDGPNKRIGPDLRLEPNFFAAAQQLQADPNYAQAPAEFKAMVQSVVEHPDRSAERARIFEYLTTNAKETEKVLTDASYDLAPLFKDIDAPGSLRKPGPSLRFADKKLDPAFMNDWISNPKNFRPSTRMPQVFGLHSHLIGSEGLHAAQEFEPLEVQGIATYVQQHSQKFEYLERPKEVTAKPDAARGKVQFQTRGCLACHSHGEFAAAEGYRNAHEIVQGPDLSGLAQKFDPQRNPKGRDWLYSWIKEPTRYHARTVMPNLFLDPIEATDESGAKIISDPVEDIVEFLLSYESDHKWQPKNPDPAKLSGEQKTELSKLLYEHLKDAFAMRTAAKYAGGELDAEGKFVPGNNPVGIPADRRDELKGAERDLVLPDGKTTLSIEERLNYIGRKSIAKYGCYGCHDIPGFEDAKPIGAGLNDWGRKEPAKLAFEHIIEYLEYGHSGHKKNKDITPEEKRPGEQPEPGEHPVDETHAALQPGVAHASHGHAAGEHADGHMPEFFLEQIFHGNRIGFLYQKLREPRSYDYHKTETKKYNDRLRMPQFPFNDEDREAVMTFVLGLVADPPVDKYVYKPSERNKAIIEGNKVLEKFNCQGCHVLKMEEWSLAFPKEFFGQQISDEDLGKVYPFLLQHVTPDQAAASAKPDRRGLQTASLAVMPRVEANDGRPSATDPDGEPLTDDDNFDPTKIVVYFDLWSDSIIGGKPFLTGIKPMNAPLSMVEGRTPAHGGMLTRYLIPTVTKIDGNQKGGEAMGWLPPPLIGEGKKVQSQWLHDFLLEPYAIRPAVFLRMPKFNMTPDEATKLAAYFAAIDNAEYPYAFSQRRQSSHLEALNSEYQQRLSMLPEDERPKESTSRLDGALNIVTSQDFCVKCHIVGNYVPGMGQPTPPSPRSLAPDLTRVYSRLRPDYVREWIANPKTKLPYTAMPVNIPYDASDKEHLGGVKQELYHGTSVEQLDGLVDLLMNFDQYSKGQTDIAKRVPPPPAAPPAAEAGASAENTEK
jgi:hypothetical protein